MIQGYNIFNIDIVTAIEGVTFFHQQLETEHHILGSDRLAIVETRLGAQVKLDPVTLRVKPNALGQQAIDAKRLGDVFGEQGIVDVADANSRRTTNDKRVGRVKTAAHRRLGQDRKSV